MKPKKVFEEENPNSLLSKAKFQAEKNLYDSELALNKAKSKIKKLDTKYTQLTEVLAEVNNKTLPKLEKELAKLITTEEELKKTFHEVGKKLAQYAKQSKVNSKDSNYKTVNKNYFKVRKELFKIELLIKDKKHFVRILRRADATKIAAKLKKIDNKRNELRNLIKIDQENNKRLTMILKEAEAKIEARKKAIRANSDKPINPDIILSVENLNIYYGRNLAVSDVTIDIPKNKIISIIGPSGCGKSTFLRTLNRINDEIPGFSAEGKIILDNEYDILKLASIFDPEQRLTLPFLRTKIGMVFQQPSPFPTSIYKNVSYGPKINGVKNKSRLDSIVISSLKKAALYDEVKNNLKILATGLSGGQQQRLCIARAIANSPDILLMDEPTSALDPIASSKVEELILSLKKDYTIILVTHSMQQAARISDKTAFFYQGKLIEFGDTRQIFESPKKRKTEDYIRGKFG